MEDRSPTETYFSKNGEHSILIETNTVILMGGFYNQCLRTTQLDTITRHFLVSNDALTIHLPISGIYAHRSIDFTKLNQQIFLKRAMEGSILGGYRLRDHGDWIDSDMNLVTGLPNLNDYTVNIYTNNTLIHKSGTGTRFVHLKFWSEKQFFSMFSEI